MLSRKKEHYFMSLLCLVILHLLAEVMIRDYLQELDPDNAVIMEVLGLSKKFVHPIKEIKTPFFDQFLNGLQKGEFGNIQYWCESGHLKALYNSARPVRRIGNDDRFTSIRSDLNALKEKIINNLLENAVNQS